MDIPTKEDPQKIAVEPLCRTVTQCRMCKSSRLTTYLDLGHTPPADQFRTKDELDLPEVWYPLRVLLCEECGLSQLSHVVDPRVLYQHDYPYESSTTATGKKHWDAFAEAVCIRLALPKESLVVDVGSNVGILLASFREHGMNIVGIDPASNIAKIANENGILTYDEFFGHEIAETVKEKHGQATVVVGTNVFAHIDDLDAMMEATLELLAPQGVFIFESPYLQPLVDHLEYDTVYHEHLSYLSFAPVVRFAGNFGLEVFAVEESEIHGGAFRVYMARKGEREIDSSVGLLLARETGTRLNELGTLKAFAVRVEENRKAVTSLIGKLRAEGKEIVALSAPAKGMTLLNYCGITNAHLSFATEKSKLKIGRYTPGGHIPVVSDEELLSKSPDYAILLAWNFAPEIMANNSEFQKRGGKFIIPIPEPRIV